MSWWSRLVGGKAGAELRSPRPDYLNEALALERQGDYDAALTSYRLALRDRPNDRKILQNMAMVLTRTGQVEEAIRYYRRALDIDPTNSGSHYGLAFLLLKRADYGGAEYHLEAFLASPPPGAEGERFVHHAQQTLESLQRGDQPGAEIES